MRNNNNYDNYSKDELIKEIKKLKKRKKYGVVWDAKPEEVAELCKEKLPILEEDITKEIKTDEKNYLKTLVAFEHYKEIKQMKVWPFSPKMLFELFAYILLPTVLALTGWYLQII